MSGIALLLDLWRKNPNFSTQNLHSYGLFSATVAASVASGRPFASRALFGDGGTSVAYADAGAEWAEEADAGWIEEYIPNLQTSYKDIYQNDALKYSSKEYPIELKPIYSAFQLSSFAMTSLRSFLMFYLPLLEPRSIAEEDDDDFLQDVPEEQHIDLVIPFKKSVKQIVRETTVVTTRRLLERLAVHYVSRRMAWKLLKDVSKSAIRKATRGMPSVVYFYSVSKTTLRGHLLGITASWIVQVGIEIYRCFSYLFKNKEEADEVNEGEQIRILGRKISRVTVGCSASLVFASIGAGIGATLFRPSSGQWVGCAIGDFVGPTLVFFYLEKHNLKL
ncbi:hypothetical protein GIB67_013408 [Kingdonia uniflora]|uniref:Uncharacterized protein n=1 Tax=Kingdonia uniflora TaxID=39325 RepID=A0A7J7LR07_9MAGN|nr:hypothetical protein GIB67_013408 [Kingdonia uniflora]